MVVSRERKTMTSTMNIRSGRIVDDEALKVKKLDSYSLSQEQNNKIAQH